MNIRSTKDYKQMYSVENAIEVISDKYHLNSAEEKLAAWQYLEDFGSHAGTGDYYDTHIKILIELGLIRKK